MKTSSLNLPSDVSHSVIVWWWRLPADAGKWPLLLLLLLKLPPPFTEHFPSLHSNCSDWLVFFQCSVFSANDSLLHSLSQVSLSHWALSVLCALCVCVTNFRLLQTLTSPVSERVASSVGPVTFRQLKCVCVLE